MISVVMVTYNRAHLFRRSLEVYATQPYKDFELIVVDDDSTDNTQELLKEFSDRINIVSIVLRKQPGLWRDCAANINLAIRAAKGDLIIATHPEVIPGLDSLSKMDLFARDNIYYSCKIYYLRDTEQAVLDSVDWKSNPLAVRNIPDFYESAPAVDLPDYSHNSMDTNILWESWVFGAMTKATWRRIGGMTEFDTWGSVDMDFMMRRHLLRIPTCTFPDETTICIHQNHDDIMPKDARNMEKAKAVLPIYNSPEEAIHNNL